MAALCDVAGGWFYDCDADENLEPIYNPDLSGEVVIALQTALSVESGPNVRTLLIDRDGDSYLARFAELESSDSGSEAERRMLRLARAFLRPELTQHDLVVITYREEGMDLRFRKGAWSLVVDQLGELSLGSLRTLVVLAEGYEGVNVGIHCQYGRGFDYAHIAGELLVRNPEQNLAKRAAQFASLGSPLVLFLGAGFSQSSELPMGNSLRDQSIKTILGLGSDSLSASDELARQFLQSERDHLIGVESTQSQAEFVRLLTFERVMRVEKRLYPALPTLQSLLRRESEVLDSPGRAARSLRQMVASPKRLVVFTVNLDRLVEHDVADLVRVFATEAEFEEAPQYISRYLRGEEEMVPIVKLHGTLADFASCVVSDDATLVGVSEPKRNAIRAAVGSPGSKTNWVYVGASMRDLDLSPVFNSTEFLEGVTEYWAMPHVIRTISDLESSRSPFWAKDVGDTTLQDHLITETADAFLNALASRW